VFAGVTHVPLLRVLPPLALASALWYGALVFLGRLAGRNFEAIMAFFERASMVLLAAAALLIGAFVFWWWRSRHAK
jgi:membrane protein DedA with SNARE-associated domain